MKLVQSCFSLSLRSHSLAWASSFSLDARRARASSSPSTTVSDGNFPRAPQGQSQLKLDEASIPSSSSIVNVMGPSQLSHRNIKSASGFSLYSGKSFSPLQILAKGILSKQARIENTAAPIIRYSLSSGKALDPQNKRGSAIAVYHYEESTHDR